MRSLWAWVFLTAVWAVAVGAVLAIDEAWWTTRRGRR